MKMDSIGSRHRTWHKMAQRQECLADLAASAEPRRNIKPIKLTRDSKGSRGTAPGMPPLPPSPPIGCMPPLSFMSP